MPSCGCDMGTSRRLTTGCWLKGWSFGGCYAFCAHDTDVNSGLTAAHRCMLLPAPQSLPCQRCTLLSSEGVVLPPAMISSGPARRINLKGAPACHPGPGGSQPVHCDEHLQGQLRSRSSALLQRAGARRSSPTRHVSLRESLCRGGDAARRGRQGRALGSSLQNRCRVRPAGRPVRVGRRGGGFDVAAAR